MPGGNEGLWLPIFLDRLRGVDLQKAGLHLTAEEIYDINRKSLKDAIGLFNGNCSAGVISKSGLLITNHHCGYEAIQGASTPDREILDQGFWANTLEQEIPNKDSYVSFLVRMEDVTTEVLQSVDGVRGVKRKG